MSLPDEDEAAQFRANHREDLKRLCRLLAASEARLYDSRARTLKSYHPLGVQVQLETGVANGVLVVREIAQCAEVLRRILTNSLEFEVRHDKDMWYLREVVSQSSFRVVTNNRKLTNCFWNFYMAAEHGM